MLSEVTARQRELHDLAGEYQELRSFAFELRRATRGKPFDIANTLAWSAVRSMHRMLVIDLAAWARSISSGWLRRTIQGDALRELRATNRKAAKLLAGAPVHAPREILGYILKHRHESLMKSQREALRFLFGKEAEARGFVEDADVGRLVKKLELWAANLDALRNELAHRYGYSDPALKAPRLADLGKRIAYCGRLLNSLRLLIDGSTYLLPRLEASKDDVGSRDLVDLIVVGSIHYAVEQWQAMPGPHLWYRRDAYYRWMHSRRRKNRKASFNRPALDGE
jgi:hypothetical protein